MKKNSIIGVVIMTILFGFSATSCKDMLLDESDRYNYETATDTLYSYWGILRCVQEVAERQIILGEVRGDLVTGTAYMSDSIHAIANFDNPQDGSNCFLQISDYYAIVNNCNAYIASADTNKIQGNTKFMLPEYKQVQIIRSWAYLQLVQNYGEVPFILEPITSLEVLDRFDGTMVNRNNIVNKLIHETGLEKFSDLAFADYPNYGNYNNGSLSIGARLLLFSADVVMGDIYLVAGQYDKAAQSYYNFLNQEQFSNAASNGVSGATISANTGHNGTTSYSGNRYLEQRFKTFTNTPFNNTITIVPGAANRRFGKMLTKHVNLMGWTTESSITTSGEGESTDDVTDAASISISPDYRLMQITPSSGFYTLSGKQTYNNLTSSDVIRVIEGGDARKNSTTDNNTQLPIYNFSPSGSSDSYQFINKFTTARGISYSIPLYHKSQIYLRFAEAINRAGHPEFAFAILKDGLCADNLPTLEYITTEEPILDEDGNETGEYEEIVTPNVIAPIAQSGGAYYVDLNALVNAENVPYLSFSNTKWDVNELGIHAAGCGETSGMRDTVYTYAKMLEAYVAAGNLLETKQDTINAIENVIVDEMALELSFEGYRFTDLVRVANHKIQAGYQGKNWIADKVARRNDDGHPSYEATSEYQTLYNKLLNESNWYLHKPATYK